MISRPILCLLLMLSGGVSLIANTLQNIGGYDTVTVAPMKTSIYVGSLALTTGVFRREGDQFISTYDAKVRPWFFWGETGRITITLPLAELEKLAHGERIEFSGEAVNNHNKSRKVTGRADQTGGASGKIKIRIKVEDTEVILNGNYRFNNTIN